MTARRNFSLCLWASLACLPALLVALPLEESKDSGSEGVSPFVIGGRDAEKDQFPQLVSLQQGTFPFCGGAILDKRWILTAAHCIDENEPEDVSVLAGTKDNSNFDKGVRVQASEFHIHPDWSRRQAAHDVALIKLKEDLPLSDSVRIAPLQREATKGGEKVILAGWGRTSRIIPWSSSDKLQWAEMELLTDKQCQDAFGRRANIRDDHLCAVAPNDGREASCQGDSGGPLFHNGHVVGVVSWSMGRCGDFPSVFADIAEHYDWIKSESGLSL